MKRTLLLAALLTGLCAPAEAQETRVRGSHYPTEIAIGPVLGLAGPGLAWRQYVLPWAGFQIGANSWGVHHATGGALILSPYRDDHGHRVYFTGGAAFLYSSVDNLTKADVVPAFGAGASRVINDRWTFFVDTSIFPLHVYRSIYIPFISPQLGFLYTF